MTHDYRARRFQVEALTRVEGEGGLIVEIRDGELADVRLRIFEPPRFFEAFLRGRAYTEPPDITARICGICPVAYQMSACQALEAACGVHVDDEIRALRHLLYCGEWIESHVLHIHLLHAPDFLGYPSGLAMAADHRFEVERGLALKKVGNRIVEVVGGRAVHPVNVKVGGFYSTPTVASMRELADDLRQALDDAIDVARWVSTFPMPDHELPDGNGARGAAASDGVPDARRATREHRGSASTSVSTSSPITSPRCRWSTRRHCTDRCWRAATTSSARSPASR